MPLVISIHGSARRAERLRDSVTEFSERAGAAILAPLFPAGIYDPNDTHNYKFLCYKDIRYDLILLSIVDEVAQRWPGIETAKFFLTGFSGGGQFASRFFYLHPERLHAVSIGAPGMVTSLDKSLAWPKGLKNIEEQFDGLSVDTTAMSKVKFVQLLVGDQDNRPPGGDLFKWFTARKTADETQDTFALSLPNRIEAMERLRDQLTLAGVKVRHDVVPGAGHDSMEVQPLLIEFLQGAIHEVFETAYSEQ